MRSREDLILNWTIFFVGLSLIILIKGIILLILQTYKKYQRLNSYPNSAYKIFREFQKKCSDNILSSELPQNSMEEFIFCSELSFYIFYQIHSMLNRSKYAITNEETLVEEIMKAERRLAKKILQLAPKPLNTDFHYIVNIIRDRFNLYSKHYDNLNDTISFDKQNTLIWELYNTEKKILNDENTNLFIILNQEEILKLDIPQNVVFKQFFTSVNIEMILNIASSISDELMEDVKSVKIRIVWKLKMGL